MNSLYNRRKESWSVIVLNYTKTMNTLKSSNGLYDLHYYIYTPKKRPKYLLQITHGMCEYLERYEDFIDFMTKNGVLVVGHDHAGHGRSLRNLKDLGYFSPNPYDLTLVKDLRAVTTLFHDTYPNLPHFILGHSMGSFVLRKYLMQFGRSLNGVIISGTGGKNNGLSSGLLLAKGLGKIQGDAHRSKLFNKIFFGGFNKRFKEEDDSFAWLSRDKKVKKAYRKDPKCNYIFTLNAFQGFLSIMKEVVEDEAFQSFPKEVPFHFISGTEDPVGNYGKGVTETVAAMKKAGVHQVTLKLYEGGRHEMLNEINKNAVYEDLYQKLEGYYRNLKDQEYKK